MRLITTNTICLPLALGVLREKNTTVGSVETCMIKDLLLGALHHMRMLKGNGIGPTVSVRVSGATDS